jgi:DNA modification methylase
MTRFDSSSPKGKTMTSQTNVDGASMQSIVIPSVPFRPYYQDALVTIYNADCRQVLPFLPKFDLLLTDPPYGIGADKHEGPAEHGWKQWNSSGWDKEKPPAWLLEMIREAAKEAIVWGGNYYSLPPSMGWLVWDKGQRDFSLADAELAWTSRQKAVRCFDYSRAAMMKEGRVHPTQKPSALMKWCLGLVPEAQTVLDPFAGSGTTGVACKLEGRKATLIEISEEYCEKAAKRLSQGVLF